MELISDFDTFLKEIRPTASMLTDCQNGHSILRERLNSDKNLQPFLISDFLQGSYRRSTAVRPINEVRSDVDIIVVTNLLESEYSPREALSVFEPFLEKHYKGKWRPQGRSFGIELSYIDMDLVITSAPSENEFDILKSDAVRTMDEIEVAKDWRLNTYWLSLGSRRNNINAKSLLDLSKEQQEWKLNPLRIPDRDVNIWEDTHPLEQIRWTQEMNKKTDGNFVNIVKCIKWWWLEQYNEARQPKGFPLERIIGDCCSVNITSVADGITKTFETIITKYNSNEVPELPDYGVPGHNVLKRITLDEFSDFYKHVESAALLARQAYDSSNRNDSGNLWRKLLGNKFPPPPNNGGSNNSGYTSPKGPSVPGSGRFA